MSFMEKMSSLVQCVVTRNTEFIVYFPCGIDPYHVVAILNLKRGWTGINNVLIINYAFLRWLACALFMPVRPRFKSKISGT